ncbi:hypothetical protein EXS71_03470 [Candidatus Uhrbacteria bacterium]|nr:hypothetical protein [Candidatus Uhrbacteria bacterium]
MTAKSITSGQRDSIKLLGSEAVGEVLQELGLDRDQAQQLWERGGEFKLMLQPHILAAARQFALSNQFANEEVASSCIYPPQYKGPKSIVQQASILNGFFPGIGSVNEKLGNRPLVEVAEGNFVIPPWQKIASTYGGAVEIVFAKIAETRKLHNYREGQLGAQYLRQTGRSVQMFKKLVEQQKGFDLLVVPAQFGFRHRGRSVRRVRELFVKNEFGLGAFASGIMLLTHPERLVKYEDLWMDCAGDEYDFGARGTWGRAPFVSFGDGELRFRADHVGDPYEVYGSVSGFLPESQS